MSTVRVLQSGQSIRARRWATTQSTAEAVRKDSIPIFWRRVIADGASFVCSVVRTMWPVSAASIAILAVSGSRTSPTMITSGSARRIERRPTAKSRPALRLTPIWLTPGIWYSTGSSIVMMFLAALLISLSAE